MEGNVSRFECPICLENFDFKKNDRVPKLLPCVHTVCHECLQDLISHASGKKLTCPLCRSDVTLTPEGIKAFKTNIYLIPDSDSSPVKVVKEACPFCAREEGPFRRLECGHIFCTSCSSSPMSLAHSPSGFRCPLCRPQQEGLQRNPQWSQKPDLQSSVANARPSRPPPPTRRKDEQSVLKQKIAQIAALAVRKQQQHLMTKRDVPKTPEARSGVVPQERQAMVPRIPRRIAPPVPENLVQSKPDIKPRGIQKQFPPRMMLQNPGNLTQSNLLETSQVDVPMVPIYPVLPSAPVMEEDESEAGYETIFNVKDRLEGELWYVGGINRQESVRKLKSSSLNNGAFAVRRTVKNESSDHVYTIDVLYEQREYHVKIMKAMNGQYCIGRTTFKPEMYDDVQSLIKYHQFKPLTMTHKDTGMEINVVLKPVTLKNV